MNILFKSAQKNVKWVLYSEIVAYEQERILLQ